MASMMTNLDTARATYMHRLNDIKDHLVSRYNGVLWCHPRWYGFHVDQLGYGGSQIQA